MIDFVQFLTEIQKAPTIEAAFTILEKNLTILGFDRVVYSLITDHPSLGQKFGHGIFRNYPEDWMKYYFANDYFYIDPTIKIIKQSDGPFLWKDSHQIKQGLKRNEYILMEEARECKLLDGIGISFHGRFGEIVGMGVASSSGKVDLNPTTVKLVYALCSQFHIIYREKEQKIPDAVVQLSPQEAQVLTWAAEGKSKSCIGQIMNISDDTVKTYFSRIFQKLGVNTVYLAILKGIFLGLIRPQVQHKFRELQE